MRHIGVDLHTNSFTACYLEQGKPEYIKTFRLQNIGDFIKNLQETDEVALEATCNSCFFYDEVSPYVKRVVMIAPLQFEVIRRSVNKTDKHDARAIAFFLSKDMLPEAKYKSKQCQQLASIINKMHGLFNYHGIKIKKEVLTTKSGFERSLGKHEWSDLERVEIEVISSNLEVIRESLKKLEKEIIAFAKQLPGLKISSALKALVQFLQLSSLQQLVILMILVVQKNSLLILELYREFLNPINSAQLEELLNVDQK